MKALTCCPPKVVKKENVALFSIFLYFLSLPTFFFPFFLWLVGWLVGWLFCFVLFCFGLFCFVLFCVVLFC